MTRLPSCTDARCPSRRWAVLSRAVVLTALAMVLLTGCAGPSMASTGFLIGVNVHVARLDLVSSPEQVDRQLKLAESVGANSVRMDVDWSNLQPTSSRYYNADYRSRLDRVFHDAKKDNLRVIVAFLSTPCWASSAPATVQAGCASGSSNASSYPPTHAVDYADAAKWLAERYSSQLGALEVWNEPDYSGPGTTWVAADPVASYVALLRETSIVLRKAHVSVPVIGGSLMNPDVTFLRSMFRDGARPYLDGLSVHVYDTDNASVQSSFRALTKVTKHLPIWVTETGYSTCPTAVDATCVDEAQQGPLTKSSIHFLTSFRRVRAVEVYELVDDHSSSAYQDNWGLYSADLKPKDSARTLSQTFAQLYNH